MEEDRERAELLREISELLLSGGYFRAQISTLSPFDMLTGGLAWSITASNVDVDFDVLYDDDATLGYKIKVGEAIEEALQRMGCPYPLQAHQIQGLDYPAVLLVVQWLVKRVLATREESGDQLRKYSLWKFQQHYALPGEVPAVGELSTRQFDSELHLQANDGLADLQLDDANNLGGKVQESEPISSIEQQTAALEKQVEFQKARLESLQSQRDSALEAAEQVNQLVKKEEGRRSVGQRLLQREQSYSKL